MLFMNEWDIKDAAIKWRDHAVLGPASRTLESLMEAANANSDGWHSWPKPCRAAKKLQELIQQGDAWKRQAFQQPRAEEPTAAQLKAALSPIKAFRTRSGIHFTIYGPGQ